jgi:hypothetical protein
MTIEEPSHSDSKNQRLSKIEQLSNQIDELLVTINAQVLANDIQAELGKVINLLRRLNKFDKRDDYNEREHVLVLQLLVTVLQSLLTEVPNIMVARETRRELQDIINRRWPITRWFHSCQPAIKVLCGLLLALALIWLFHIPFMKKLQSVKGVTPSHLTTAILYGAMGSIASIMIRLHDFYKSQDGATSYFFLIGCYKPFIGVLLALFAYATLYSGMVLLKPNSENVICSIMAISFLAGFSERFAKDLTEKAEGDYLKSKPTNQ